MDDDRHMHRVSHTEDLELLKWRAYHDEKTGLYNHHYLNQCFEQQMQTEINQKAVLIYFDIINLKRINTFYGEGMGDWVILIVGDRLSSLSSEEIICARIQSKTFAIYIKDSNEISHDQIRQVLATVGKPVLVDEEEVTLEISAGLAFAPKDAAVGEDLMRCAELALAYSKESGNDSIQSYNPQLEERALRRAMLTDALESAIKNKDFILHYQPQIDANSGELVAVEALIRWKLDGEGMIAPGEFIPIAEQSGKIVKMGRWILEQACRDAVNWSKPIRVSVNVSAAQLMKADFAQQVEGILQEAGLPPERLRLEITESAFIYVNEGLKHTLRELQYQGVDISLDDFGTGYSSLNHLNDFPIDEIKIDQSFIKGIGFEMRSEAIIRMILKLAESLHIKSMAEGVETSAQVVFLTEFGCDCFQGYFFGQPMSNADLIERIIEDKRHIH